MFGRRKTNTSQATIERLREQRDYHQSRAETAQAVVGRIAGKFTAGHDLCWAEVARLAHLDDAHANLLTRHGRLLRAIAQERSENAVLRSGQSRDIEVRVLKRRLADEKALTLRLNDDAERSRREIEDLQRRIAELTADQEPAAAA
ncbi:hypothetical protein [Kitasatospora sp. NPDC001175]|uniref:hypothetical protein n=1 Tax=Kitasatospora sp. NPDC001175 TaxID=3157103 RepID=UPI003D05FEDA